MKFLTNFLTGTLCGILFFTVVIGGIYGVLYLLVQLVKFVGIHFGENAAIFAFWSIISICASMILGFMYAYEKSSEGE